VWDAAATILGYQHKVKVFGYRYNVKVNVWLKDMIMSKRMEILVSCKRFDLNDDYKNYKYITGIDEKICEGEIDITYKGSCGIQIDKDRCIVDENGNFKLNFKGIGGQAQITCKYDDSLEKEFLGRIDLTQYVGDENPMTLGPIFLNQELPKNKDEDDSATKTGNINILRSNNVTVGSRVENQKNASNQKDEKGSVPPTLRTDEKKIPGQKSNVLIKNSNRLNVGMSIKTQANNVPSEETASKLLQRSASDTTQPPRPNLPQNMEISNCNEVNVAGTCETQLNFATQDSSRRGSTEHKEEEVAEKKSSMM
jgi:hypothetical protein